MRVRFIHVADLHLGYQQYNLEVRADDFARAYFAMVEHAIEVKADFVLIAGDLFHKANPDAWSLKQATAGLQQLRSANIPAVAIEGNHDAPHVHRHLSWLEYLCDQELLSLLDVDRAPNGYRSLVPFDLESRRGSYLDLAGVRVYGMKYYGVSTARILEELHEEIEAGESRYTVLMLHAGLQGQVPHLHGGLTPSELEPLRGRVDYLALGHIHKRLMDDWIFNPGSTEINSMEEIDWPHGFFEVEVDTDAAPKHTVHAVDTPTLRAFRRISVSADGVGSLEEFIARAEERISAERAIPERAVIELHLGGVAEFRRQEVPLERLKTAVETRFSPLLVRVRNALVPPGVLPQRRGERVSREELEREIVEQLVRQHAEHRERAADWARLILDVKNMAVEKDLPASIADHIQARVKAMSGFSPSTEGELDPGALQPIAVGSEPGDGQVALEEL